MKQKFKLGDTVRIISNKDSGNCSDYGIGHTFKVEEIVNSNVGDTTNWYREEKGISNGVSEECLELAEPQNKFKVGDIIVNNDVSGHSYGVTNKREGFVGKVIDILDFNLIMVKTIDINNKGYIGGEHKVESKYFDLQTPDEIKAGDTVECIINDYGYIAKGQRCKVINQYTIPSTTYLLVCRVF